MSNVTPSTARTTSSLAATGKCLKSPRTRTSSSRTSAVASSARAAETSACGTVSPRSLVPGSTRAPFRHPSYLAVGRDRRRQVVEHAAHGDAALQLIERDVALRAARHALRAARREVAALRQVRRLRHGALDGREP